MKNGSGDDQGRDSGARRRRLLGYGSGALWLAAFLVPWGSDDVTSFHTAVVLAIYLVIGEAATWFVLAHATMVWAAVRLMLGKWAGWAPIVSLVLVATSAFYSELLFDSRHWNPGSIMWIAALALQLFALACDFRARSPGTTGADDGPQPEAASGPHDTAQGEGTDSD